ncbi:hypothetical protein FF38_03417 [Lucilia cuprina]|uniref:Uncharacterized protein n=1 Tax=Lucilia cuprina TaxID=7375 RepID=A0A0L0BZI8_LUCCU|nr:hypothetical protein FF38_03417 [Lucilia cuprina]
MFSLDKTFTCSIPSLLSPSSCSIVEKFQPRMGTHSYTSKKVHGTFDDNLTEKSFKTHLRDAIKLAKNRFFKEKRLTKEQNPPKESHGDVLQNQVNMLLSSKYPSIF